MTDANTTQVETAAVTIPEIKVGMNVVYVGTKGYPKLALVTNTPETVVAGTSLPTLSEGQVHLVVWEHSQSHFTPRYNVPFEGQVAANSEFQNGEGTPVGFWKIA